ncbi:hypothetical protein AB1Y20_011288 [Prymnesium parvum]|uniref:Helicase ATP-binding domain-containing protein n=1 Tax=Prymnesium parvum TaxID=97485 RepID=A0AB34IM56_PRYPA
MKRAADHPFGFPFPPYPQQETLMRDLYQCLDDGGVGIFESPTGTGKSLSFVCGALRWLLDQEDKCDTPAAAAPADEPSWISEQAHDLALASARRGLPSLAEERLVRARRLTAYEAGGGRRGRTATKPPPRATPRAADGDEEFALDESGGSGEGCADEEWREGEDEEEAGGATRRQIFYCSRTHSQLAQVVREVRRTSYADQVSVVTLGSRKALCVNETLKAEVRGERLNEACLDLQQSARKAKGEEANGKGCPYMPSRGEEAHLAAQAVRDRVLQQPHDVEELAAVGRRNMSCPYYASRAAVAHAQLVLLPYASLLHADTRASLGLQLDGAVVIIDEAHNLIDTINETHSVTISGAALSELCAQLAQYHERYQARLKPSNRLCVQRLLYVVRALRAALLPKGNSGGEAVEKMVGINHFLCSLNIDNINLFELKAFCKASEIAKKLKGFADHQHSVVHRASSSRPPPGSLHAVLQLLEALTNDDADGRILLHLAPPGAPEGSWLRSLHLNPSVYFSPILQRVHSLVLAGGTMQPFADLEQQLFHLLRKPRLRTHSYGHIVPPRNLLPLALTRTPSGDPLTFTLASRASPPMMAALGALLLDLCAIVPDGVIVFIPSFQYEAQLVAHWQADGTWGALAQRKRLFREPREACDVDALLAAYSAAIDSSYEGGGGGHHTERVAAPPRGAVLLSVVGGKMSEGINFADGMGRCVVMVGMPYANPQEMCLQEKMAYLDQAQGSGAGKQYYTNLCMKAVNQSIGRAIRHKADYATIILADQRYAKEAVVQHLPRWIASQVRAQHSPSQACASVRTFFEAWSESQHKIEEQRRSRANDCRGAVVTAAGANG